MDVLMMKNAHDRAFSAVAAMPVRLLAEASCLIDQLMVTGASSDEAYRALRQLFERFQETQKEPA